MPDLVDADERTGSMKVWLEPSSVVEAEVADSVLPGRSVGLAYFESGSDATEAVVAGSGSSPVGGVLVIDSTPSKWVDSGISVTLEKLPP